MKRNPATLRETNFEATVTRFEFSRKFSRKSKGRFCEAGDSPRSGFGHVFGTQGVLLCHIRKSTCICKKFRSRIPGFASWKCFLATFSAPQRDSLCHKSNPGKFLQLFMARRRSVGNSNNFFALCGTRGARGCIGGARRALKSARNAFPRVGGIQDAPIR